MALTVEDGSGVAGAESYITVEDFRAYAAAIGREAAGDDEAVEQALRRATRYIDSRYRERWSGKPTRARGQRLAWPRTGVRDRMGNTVESDEVPFEVKDATAEAAVRELETPGSLDPDIVPAERVVSESIGPISTTYQQSGDATALRPIVGVIDGILSNLIDTRGSVSFLQRA